MNPPTSKALQKARKEYKEKSKEAREKKKLAQQARQAASSLREEDIKKAEDAEEVAEKAEKGRHLAALVLSKTHQPGEENGCVTRCLRSGRKYEGHDYRKNGFNYQLKNESEWYNLDFHVKGSEARKRLENEATRLDWGKLSNPMSNSHAWDMKEGGQNFRSGGYPWGKYGNAAHHIVPVGSLYDAFQQDLRILQRAKYNINKGINIIILPTRGPYDKIYQLPTHLGKHKTYSNAVHLRLRGMKEALSRAKSRPGGHPELAEKTAENWKSQLEQFSLTMRRAMRKAAIVKAQAGQQEITIDTIFSRAGLSR
jgi:hypothetical protein